MKTDFTFPSSDGVTQIHAVEWTPDRSDGSKDKSQDRSPDGSKDGSPRAILQISHGMVEHIERYAPFAAYLCSLGFVVVGNDHLGHGASVTDDKKHGYFAKKHGDACVVEDLHTLRGIIQRKYPGVPYFMLGHSMGSFIIRRYAMLHGEGLRGVIIMGTGSQPGAVLVGGTVICHVLALFYGWEARSRFVDRLAFSSNNNKFQPARTPQDWLTKDETIVDAYRADPWCTYIFTLNGFLNLFRTIRFIQRRRNIDRIPKELPLLLVSGADDPVGAFGKGVRQVYDAYRRAGITDVQMKLYPGDRHEILNETDREAVYADLAAWLTAGI